MSRLIDADKLLEFLDVGHLRPPTEICFSELMMKNIIDLQPTVQQWIPVTERLPINDDWIIVTILDESGDTPYIHSDFGWYLNKAECWIVDAEQRTDVIAWMPLPAPWKGSAV